MKLARLRAYMDELNAMEWGEVCKHGHSNCAIRTGGRCSDELWNQQCDDESDESYDLRISENDFPEEVNDAEASA